MENSVAKINYNGNEFLLKGLFETDHIFKHLKITGNFYELKLLEKVKSLNLKGTYIDVGANIGNHTVYFSKFCNSENVISIELDYKIYNVLNENINNLKLSNVKTINTGIGEKFKFVKTSNIDITNVGMTKIINGDGDIIVNTLDSVLSDVKNISLIKLDIEGYEKNALLGAKNIIAIHSPIIIAELRDGDEFNEFEKIINQMGYYTDKINYASTPTYFWYKKNKMYDYVYIIPTYERFEKVSSLINDILNTHSNTLVILLNDGSKDNRYDTFKTLDQRIVYLKNDSNNGKDKYWKTINVLLDELSKYDFKYGIMIGDDFKLVDDFLKKLESYVSDEYIVRLFTQIGVGNTNWGFQDWVDGAFCAHHSFFKQINFELFPIQKRGKLTSSGVGLQMSKRITNLGIKVKNFGSLIEHIGNYDSKMHPIVRSQEPLISDFINNEKNSKKISIIIPTYKNVQFLPECFESVLKSIKDLDCEILVGIDGCKDTLEYVKKHSFDNRFKFYFFEKNVGPYVIKNTLANILSSDKLLFFDSDDIMLENIITDTLSILDNHNIYRPMYLDFVNGTTPKSTTNIKTNHFGYGVFGIKKDFFISLNGFNGWRCEADSDFHNRLRLNNTITSIGKTVSFLRRIHTNSLTTSPETNYTSKLRAHYRNLTNKNNKPVCEKFETSNYTIVNVTELKEQRKIILEQKNNIKKLLTSIIGDTTIKTEIDYSKINEVISKNNSYDVKSSIKPIRENLPKDRNELLEKKKNSNTDQISKILPVKPNRRNNSPNIFGSRKKI